MRTNDRQAHRLAGNHGVSSDDSAALRPIETMDQIGSGFSLELGSGWVASAARDRALL
jgi:hypothetical protein